MGEYIWIVGYESVKSYADEEYFENHPKGIFTSRKKAEYYYMKLGLDYDRTYMLKIELNVEGNEMLNLLLTHRS